MKIYLRLLTILSGLNFWIYLLAVSAFFLNNLGSFMNSSKWVHIWCGDSGLTIEFLVKRLKGASPRSISIITLLLKPDIAKLSLPIDIIGFEIAPDFVVGYGLDYEQDFRHLPAVYRLEK